MDKLDTIKRFANERPEAIGVYGYGSSVFKQATQNSNTSQTDVIFAVNSISEWHCQNIEQNPNDYSFIGKIHLSRENIAKLKGPNNITYVSRVECSGCFFKYGVIEITDFLRSLKTWDNLFIAGRFQKPTLSVISEDFIEEAIAYNRECALIIASLFSNKLTTINDLYTRLCGLSYQGDARMMFAENPHKVRNIVNGSLDILKEMYPLNEDYFIQLNNSHIIIRYDILLEKIKELPNALLKYLEELGTDFSNLEDVRQNIASYLMNRNKIESRSQIIEGFKTNGVIRSIPYALSKVKKRIVKR